MRRIVLALILVAGCDGSGSGPTGELVSAWKKAGLDPSGFSTVEGKALGGGTCQAGKVSGVDTTVCEYADADAARKAEPAGLAHVGDTTGAALTQGKLLLVVADRGKADPNGKAIKQIAAAFRNR